MRILTNKQIQKIAFRSDGFTDLYGIAEAQDAISYRQGQLDMLKWVVSYLYKSNYCCISYGTIQQKRKEIEG